MLVRAYTFFLKVRESECNTLSWRCVSFIRTELSISSFVTSLQLIEPASTVAVAVLILLNKCRQRCVVFVQ